MRMKAWIPGILFLAVAALFSLSSKRIGPPAIQNTASAAVGSNTLSEAEKAEGWMLLFDGKSFECWRGVGIEGIPQGHWVIEAEAIKKVAAGDVPRQEDGQPIRGGDLMTERTFENFELRLDWKISPGGNSGIKYNVSEELSKAHAPAGAAIGFEYQILDDERHPDAKNGPNRTAAALYDLIAPQGRVLKPVGEYNQARIVFRRNHGEHWLNGVKVLEFDLDTPRMKEVVASSKYRDIPDFAKKREGHIVLQDHGDTVWFRNIKIRDPGPF